MMFSAIAPSCREMLPLPQTAEYALRAVFEIARRHPTSMRVAELAAAVGAPANYLAKTLGQLARAGILNSTRGPSGGFRLAAPAEELTLHRIVSVFQDEGPRRCLLGGGRCGAQPNCAVHSRWKPVAVEVDVFFRSTTVADLTTTDADHSLSDVLPLFNRTQSVS
jgi:Rrf2 family protein